MFYSFISSGHRLPWTEPNLESDGVIDDAGLRIVYPYGATLSTHRPAIPILSSGLIAFPIHRPLGKCKVFPLQYRLVWNLVANQYFIVQ